MTKLYYILFVSLVLTVQICATDYMVSGAGTAAANGIYVEFGTNGEKPAYRMDIGSGSYYYLFYNVDWASWMISTSIPVSDYPDYYSSASTDLPPSTDWFEYEGYSPVPTVEIAGPKISYSASTFTESTANDGSIDNSTPIIITHNNFEGATFTGTNGNNFVTEGKVIVSNLPAGLTAVITRTGATTLSATITGMANSHNNVNDISNLTFTFQNSAFSGGNASAVGNATKSDLAINFIQTYLVASSGGDYTTIAAAITNCTNGDIINLAPETFTEAGLNINTNITIKGLGAGISIVQAAVSQGTASNSVFILNNSIITIDGVTIRYGKAEYGAAIIGGYLTLKNSEVCYNDANFAAIRPQKIIIINSTIHHNNAPSASECSGIAFNTANNSITNTTISNNSGGYCMIFGGGTLNIMNSTICNNTSGLRINYGNFIVGNTIFANNGTSDFHVVYGIDSFTDNGYNVVKYQQVTGTPTNWQFNNVNNILYNYKADGSASNEWTRNNLLMANQNLNISGTLASNNSTIGTQTLALANGSFAIDAGTNSGAPTTDQRGAGRNGTTDIGAYEWWNDEGALPVELSSFTAVFNKNKVVLAWETATEISNYRFEIEKSLDSKKLTDINFSKIGFVEGQGNSNSPKQYSFIDENPVNGNYLYRLKQIDNNGDFTYSENIAVTINVLPIEYSLSQNYPNPFNPTTNIKFGLPNAENVKIIIYNMLGQEIKTLINQTLNAGTYTLIWNGENDFGVMVTSGTYLYRIITDNYTETKKLMLIK